MLSSATAEAPEEHHVMAKHKQSYLRLPTEYKGINVEVGSLIAWSLHQLPTYSE